MARFPNTGNRGRRTVLAMGRDKFSIIELERPLGHAGGDPKPAVGFFRRACPKDNTFSIPEWSSLIMEAMGMVVQREHTE